MRIDMHQVPPTYVWYTFVMIHEPHTNQQLWFVGNMYNEARWNGRVYFDKDEAYEAARFFENGRTPNPNVGKPRPGKT